MGAETPDSCDSSIADGAASLGTDAYEVEDGDTDRFTITVVVTADATGTSAFYRVALDGVTWDTSDQDGTLNYDFNMDEFITDNIWLTSTP